MANGKDGRREQELFADDSPKEPILVAKVLVDLSLDKVFDYSIPEELAGRIKPGSKVKVPFGRSSAPRSGYVISVSREVEYPRNIKSLGELCDERPQIPDSLLKLGEWMSNYYCCSKEHALRTLLPSAVRSGKVKAKMRVHCYISDSEAAERFLVDSAKKAKAKAAILKELKLSPGIEVDSLLKRVKVGPSVLTALVKLGLVSKESRAADRDPFGGAVIVPDKVKAANPEQAAALKQIYEMLERPAGSQHVLLLHGVTGSGKTEVYLQTITRVLAKGGDSIVLVPEIALTPQTVQRFRARFGNMVSVLHSGLTDGERHDEWMKVRDGRVRIAVGARSALFAPFEKLKLIVVDEEHEGSYKQSESPRYNARDVAVMRGQFEGATVILGSATPSLESYSNALSGKYALARLSTRAAEGICMPSVTVADMRLEAKDDGKIPFISKLLLDGIYLRLSRGEQSIIFLNRRGFARQLACDCCGYVALCPDCAVAYTYHRKRETLSCHLCGSVIEAPKTCPACASDKIRYSGLGTERIESLLSSFFKSARIARMDSDTMTNPKLYEKVLSEFGRGKIDILVGTQMIAKGLDFPQVTLVGIVNADQGLYIPDFRAAERTFQLLTQVSGRAGRGGVAGEVIVQTCSPFNIAIKAAVEHDWESFYSDELLVRKELKYPPFGHLIAVHFNGVDAAAVESYATGFMSRIASAIDPETITSEPSPAPIERIKGKCRYIAIFRGGRMAKLRQKLREEMLHGHKRPEGLELHIDVDAVSLL